MFLVSVYFPHRCITRTRVFCLLNQCITRGLYTGNYGISNKQSVMFDYCIGMLNAIFKNWTNYFYFIYTFYSKLICVNWEINHLPSATILPEYINFPGFYHDVVDRLWPNYAQFSILNSIFRKSAAVGTIEE